MRNACLNLVSEYSPERGTTSVDALLDRARQIRCDIVGLVDRATLLGATTFVAGAHRRGLTPVVGVQFEVASLVPVVPPTLDSLTAPVTHPLVLFAESDLGRRNLAHLVSLAHSRPGGGLVDEDLLAHHHGLIAQSPGLVGEVSSRIQRGQADLAERLALRLAEVFGRSAVFLGVSLHGLPAEARLATQVADLARRIGLPIVASDRVDHLDEEDRGVRNARLALATDRSLADVARDRRQAPDSHFRSPAERRRLYRDLPEALDNELALAERCAAAEPLADTVSLDYPLPGGRRPIDYLASIVDVRCPREDRYRRRLQAELADVEEHGLAGWFLLQWDAFRYARRHGIAVAPMGGAVRSSLVASFLGLTDIDPVAFDLNAAHFFLEAAVGPPAITFRLPSAQRAELAAYLEHRHGREHVHHAGRVVRMTPRGAVRAAGAVLGIPETDVAAAARHVPDTIAGDVAEAVARDERMARRYVREPAVREWLELARGLSGLVIRMEADRDRLIIDAAGAASRPLVRDAHGRTYMEWAPHPADRLDGDNPVHGVMPLVIELESSGTESDPAVPRRSPDRDAAILAASLEHVARRQPALAARFAARAAGTEATPLIETRLQSILARTHGLLLEEEQLAGMARVLAGFGPLEAEAFRRALVRPVEAPGGGSSQAETMAVAERRRWRIRFVEGAVDGGLEPDQAESVFLSLAEAAPRLADRADSIGRARQAASRVQDARRVRADTMHPPVRMAAAALAATSGPAGRYDKSGRPAAAQLSMPWIGPVDADSNESRQTGTYGS